MHGVVPVVLVEKLLQECGHQAAARDVTTHDDVTSTQLFRIRTLSTNQWMHE